MFAGRAQFDLENRGDKGLDLRLPAKTGRAPRRLDRHAFAIVTRDGNDSYAAAGRRLPAITDANKREQPID